MNIQLKQYNKHLLFKANNTIGNSLLVGISEDKNPIAFRPMELLLVSLASCSSLDIIKILNKQHQLEFKYEVQVESTRRENKIPSIFKEIKLHFIFEGIISEIKLKKAVNLSLEKYCSVSKIIEETATINYTITLNGNRL